MGGQLDGIFLAGSLPHEFIILTVTSFIYLRLIMGYFLYLSQWGRCPSKIALSLGRNLGLVHWAHLPQNGTWFGSSVFAGHGFMGDQQTRKTHHTQMHFKYFNYFAINFTSFRYCDYIGINFTSLWPGCLVMVFYERQARVYFQYVCYII